VLDCVERALIVRPPLRPIGAAGQSGAQSGAAVARLAFGITGVAVASGRCTPSASVEVLAIEVEQDTDAEGAHHQTIVPRVIGDT